MDNCQTFHFSFGNFSFSAVCKVLGLLLGFLLKSSRQACYSHSSALIFGWLDLIPILKGNGNNKNPVNIYIDFQVITSEWYIFNAPKSLEGWFSRTYFKRNPWCFIFYMPSFDFAFSASAFDFWFYFFKNRPKVLALTLRVRYLEPSQTSMMELFGEIVNGWKPLAISTKISIIDAQLGSK